MAGEYVLLTVTDTGEGMTDDAMMHIFEPFYTKKVLGRSGSGLGLTVLWGTVKDHGGYVDVESTPARARPFSFTSPLPGGTSRVMMTLLLLKPWSVRGRGSSSLMTWKSSENWREKCWNALGYRVDTVTTGEEAIDFLWHNEVDLLVLDMIMDPGIDGYETYRRILRFKGQQKAIIVSGYAETERVKQAQMMGAGQFVKKPYILSKLGQAVREELARDVSSSAA